MQNAGGIPGIAHNDEASPRSSKAAAVHLGI